MASLLQYQGKDGMWRQLIDKEDAWPESSSSAMFSFAMITGVKHGWLDAKTYGPAARKSWIAGLVFPARRKVIFVHGCFWHSHACNAGLIPKSNRDFWLPKFRQNKARDRENLEALRRLG